MAKKKKPSATTGFGAKLRAARIAAGLTQKALGEQIGSNHVLINRIERGAHSPSLDSAVALARALNLPLDHFIDPPPAEGTPDETDG